MKFPTHHGDAKRHDVHGAVEDVPEALLLAPGVNQYCQAHAEHAAVEGHAALPHLHDHCEPLANRQVTLAEEQPVELVEQLRRRTENALAGLQGLVGVVGHE